MPGDALAHAVLVQSSPASGATLGAAPPSVALTFSEQPEAALSKIEVLGAGGRPVQAGPPVRDGSRGLTVRLRPLPNGVYTVRYRVLSAVDGHATAGAYAFGGGGSPAGGRLPEAPLLPPPHAP